MLDTNEIVYARKTMHWLLYTSDKEAGGFLVLGIFNSSREAWDYYWGTHSENEQYWRVPTVECWDGSKLVL